MKKKKEKDIDHKIHAKARAFLQVAENFHRFSHLHTNTNGNICISKIACDSLVIRVNCGADVMTYLGSV